MIHPLGFDLDDRHLRRAGLDYHEYSRIHEHASWHDFLQQAAPRRVFAFSTKGRRSYAEPGYLAHDAFLFGPETKSLPSELLQSVGEERVLRLPMYPESRSLNLSNAVAVVVYHAWLQHDFRGGK